MSRFKLPKGRKLVLALIAVPLLVLLAAAGGLFAALYSDFGRDQLRKQIEAAVSEEDGLKLTLGRIEGDLLSAFQLERIVLSDPDGDWLIAQDLSVSWSPFDLLDKRLSVASLKLASLDLLREPVLPANEQEEDQDLTLPSLPIDIAVDELQIERIRLAEPVAGQEAVFSLALRLNAPSGSALASEIDLAQLDGGNAALSGTVVFDPEQETLGIDMAFSEPQGGVLAKMAQLPGAPAIELSLLGDGPLSAWQGQLLAKAGDVLDAELLLVTETDSSLENLGNGKEEIRLTLQGYTRFASLLPPELAPLTSPRMDLETVLIWSGEAQSLVMETGRFETDVLRVTSQGRFDTPDQNLTAELSLRSLDSTVISSLTAPASFENALVDLQLDGNLQTLSINVDVALEELTPAPDLALAKITGSYKTTITPQNLTHLPVEGTTLVEGFSGLPPEAERLLGQKLAVSFDLDFGLTDNLLTLSAFNAKGSGIELDGSASVGLESREAKADLNLRLPDLALAAPVSGALQSDIVVVTSDFEQAAEVTIDAVVQNLDPGDPKLKKLLGERIELQSTATATPERLTLSFLTAQNAVAKVTGSAEFPLSFESITAEFEASLPDMRPLSEIATVDLSGKTSIKGRLEGDLTDPTLKGDALIEELVADGTTLGRLDSGFEIEQLASGPRGKLTSRLTHPDTTLDLATNFAVTDFQRLVLDALSLKALDAEIDGDLSLPFDGSPVTGQLRGTVADLNQLASLAGQNASGKLKFTADLEDRDRGQAAVIELQSEGLKLDRDDPAAPSLAKLSARVSGTDLLQNPGFVLSANAGTLRAGESQIDSLALEAQGTLSETDFSFALANPKTPALDFKGSGQLTLSDNVTRIGFSALEGAFENRDVRLLAPFSVTQSGKATSIEGLQLNLAGGEITASADLTSSAAKAQISLTAIPLELLTLADPQLKTAGSLGGQARLDISGNRAQGDFEFTADAVKPEGPDFKNLPPLNGRLTGNLAQGKLAFAGRVTGLEGTDIETQGTLPLDIALAPFAAAIPNARPLAAGLKLRGDLAGLWPLLALDEHLLAGKVAADLTVAGTLGQPEVKGTAALSEGRYENLEAGTLLTDLTFEATLPDAQTVEINLSSKDGDDGQVSADGRIDLSDGTNPDISLTTRLQGARLLRRDDVFAQASGTIDVTGRTNDLKVKGEIVSDLIEINVGGALPPSVVDLAVEERNRPGAAAEESLKNEAQEAGARSRVALDLALSLPRRVFIRGRGLDSEWAGQFKVKGTADAPVIEGDLSPVRGDFSFAGKSFKLQKGKVSLAGGKEVDPDLDLSAVYELDDFKALVAITGTASSPEIGFSSEPELPQDEILARILFGKSTGQLSPVEALQLAEAVASVSGQLGSGEGVLGLVRKTLGVDVLSAGTNEQSGEVEVRAGKYVADDVFVGVTQGTDPTSTKVTVEVEVTPNISVESDVGQDASGRVGVFWKWDY